MISLTLPSPKALLRLGVIGPITVDILPWTKEGTEFRVIVPKNQRGMIDINGDEAMHEAFAVMLAGVMRMQMPELLKNYRDTKANLRSTDAGNSSEADGPEDFFHEAVFWCHVPAGTSSVYADK